MDRLVERARSGDIAAFQTLAEHALPGVYRLAAAMVGAEEAGDVAQEALVAAWRALPSLRQTGRFESWLRSIVMNRARNALRRRRRHPTVSLIAAMSTPTAEESIGAVDRALDLEAAFGSLTAEQREILVLHYVADLPLREIADVIGIREGTVKSRLHAGLAALRAGIDVP